MDWQASIPWWAACGTLIAIELATGTFYLLMLSVGAAAGALAALGGAGQEAQVVAAAAFGGGLVALWHWRWRPRRPDLSDAANPDFHLDVGQRVTVEAWKADGTAEVHYRGARWSARFAGDGSPESGPHRIVAVDGNELRLDRAPT